MKVKRRYKEIIIHAVYRLKQKSMKFQKKRNLFRSLQQISMSLTRRKHYNYKA